MERFDFSCITMRTINNRKLYLCCSNGDSMKWEFSKENVCAFNTDSEAEEFGNRYFKNFKGWRVDSVSFYV